MSVYMYKIKTYIWKIENVFFLFHSDVQVHTLFRYIYYPLSLIIDDIIIDVYIYTSFNPPHVTRILKIIHYLVRCYSLFSIVAITRIEQYT